jgi:hypothetical protein
LGDVRVAGGEFGSFDVPRDFEHFGMPLARLRRARGKGVFGSLDVCDDDLPGRLDPFACFRDAGVSADGANDGARRDDLDFVYALDKVSEGEAEVVVTTGEEPGGMGVSIDGNFIGEIVFGGNLVGALPVEEGFLDCVAIGVAADGALTLVAGTGFFSRPILRPAAGGASEGGAPPLGVPSAQVLRAIRASGINRLGDLSRSGGSGLIPRGGRRKIMVVFIHAVASQILCAQSKTVCVWTFGVGRVSAGLRVTIEVSEGSGCPILAEEFGLLENCLGRLLLLVGRIAILSENAFDHCAQLGADAFFDGPIN